MRKLCAILMVILCLLITGCSETNKLFNDSIDSKNPLSEKDTDERIIMSLEKAYPEHVFSVVKSFDKKENKGIFADENGVEFPVHNLLYDNVYHFGCSDDYLATILEKENFVSKANEIASKYKCYIAEDEQKMRVVDIQPLQASNNDYNYAEYAKMVSEILNVVNVPRIIRPETTEFSTSVINYYTNPCMSIITFPVKYKEVKTSVKFYFDDKDLSIEQLKERFKAGVNDLKSGYDN